MRRRTDFSIAPLCMVVIGCAGLFGICRVGRAGMGGIEAVAQAQGKPIAEVKPESAVKMPQEYADQLISKFQESKKLQDDNAQLIQAWQNYIAKQNAIQSQEDIVIMRAAMAAKLSIEQLDRSDFVPDGKGGFQWVEKSKGKR